MDDDVLVRAAISFVVLGILVPATLWYFAIRFGKPQLKVFAIAIVLIYTVLLVVNLGHDWLDWFPPTYHTDVYGPDKRTPDPILVTDTQYHVNVPGSRHQMVLTPVSQYGEQQTAPLTLGFEVQTPTGQVVAKGRETVPPAKGSNWAPIKAEFTTPEEGEHKLILEIPKPVRKVRVEITERKK